LRPLSQSGRSEFSKGPYGAAPFVVSALLLVGTFSVDASLENRSRLENAAIVVTSENEPSKILDQASEDDDDTTDVINWSGTHKVTVPNDNLWEPETVEEVEAIVRVCHERGQAVRPLGSSLSPNGIALNSVLDIDTEKRTVTVQAGITVHRVRNSLSDDFSRRVKSFPRFSLDWSK
jgi:L-galactono-1,4-lactone dehydrogenase